MHHTNRSSLASEDRTQSLPEGYPIRFRHSAAQVATGIAIALCLAVTAAFWPTLAQGMDTARLSSSHGLWNLVLESVARLQ